MTARSELSAVALGVLLGACAQTNSPPDAGHDSGPPDAALELLPDSDRPPDDAAPDSPVPGPCSPLRSATVVVVVNIDSLNDWADTRADHVVAVVERLLDGDVDRDGTADLQPLEEVRVMLLPNEMADRERGDDSCLQPFQGEFFESECGSGGRVLRARPELASWREELHCRLADMPRDLGLCLPEPLEAALVALSPDPPPVDLGPRAPLGDSINAAYRDVDDVLVVVLESSDLRDDCSRRFEVARESDCPMGDRHCCEANLPPVTRTSDALRAIVGDRPAVYLSLGAHPPFDPLTQSSSRLDEILERPECAWRPHTRMVRLARELYPSMHLSPVVCPESPPEMALAATARHILSSVCAD